MLVPGTKERGGCSLCTCMACSSSVLMPILETQARRSPAFLAKPHQEQLPVDAHAFARGQSFFETNLFSVMVSHLVGLISLLRVVSILRVLLLTERSDTRRKSFDRYFATILHLVQWYHMANVWDRDGRGCKSLNEVRKKHAQSKTLARNKISHLISQEDMVITQWAFVAPILMQPHTFGVPKSSRHQLQDFVYFWRIMGSVLGVHDRFNLCQGSVEDVERECLAVLHQIIQPSLRDPPPQSEDMVMAMAEGLTILVPMLEPRSIIDYTSHTLGVPVSNKEFKWQYRCNIWLLETGFHIPFVGTILRFFFNFLLSLAMTLRQIFYHEHFTTKIFKNILQYIIKSSPTHWISLNLRAHKKE